MKNSTAVRSGIILSAAAAVSCLAGQYAYAYPEISIRSIAISSPSLTLVEYLGVIATATTDRRVSMLLLHKGTGRTRGAGSAPALRG